MISICQKCFQMNSDLQCYSVWLVNLYHVQNSSRHSHQELFDLFKVYFYCYSWIVLVPFIYSTKIKQVGVRENPLPKKLIPLQRLLLLFIFLKSPCVPNSFLCILSEITASFTEVIDSLDGDCYYPEVKDKIFYCTYLWIRRGTIFPL